MGPPIAQRSFVELVHKVLDERQLEQLRAGGDEQADGVLDGRDVLDKAELVDQREQVEVARKGGPRREGYKGRIEGQAHLPWPWHDPDEGLARGAPNQVLEGT